MNTRIKQTAQGFFAAVITMLTMLSTPVFADDTEIYLSSTISVNARPNVLFVLDASGSMGDGLDGSSYTKPSRMEILKSALSNVLNSIDNVNVGIMTFTANSGDDNVVAPIRYPIAYVNDDAFDVESNAPFSIFNVNTSSSDAMENQSDTEVDLSSTTLSLGNASDRPSESFSRQIPENSTDDAEEESDGDMQRGDNILEIPRNGNNLQKTGLRFRDIQIDPNAFVTEARLELKTQNYSNWWQRPNDTTNILIDLQATDDAGTFSSADNDISNRATIGSTTATAAVSWNNVDSSDNEWELSEDVSPLLNELLKRPGWNRGNDIAFILSGNTGEREFYSSDYGNNNSNAPRLHVTWGSATSSRKVVGLRFEGINIPQGAEITSAKLIVTAANDSSQAMDISVYGENTDDAVAFSESLNNVDGRDKTATPVSWTLSADAGDTWTGGQQYESVDIKAAVQDIIDRGGWCGGNALALILKANIDSDRAIYSRDGSSESAPKLQIEFDSDVDLENPRTLATNTGCTRSYISVQIDSADDDAEESPDSGAMRVNTTDDAKDLDMGTRLIGLRFENVPLPDAATIEIEKADITFRANDSSSSTSSTYTIYGHKSANSAAFTEIVPNNISTRTKTTVSAPPWTHSSYLANNAELTSPDIAPVIAEIIAEDNWAATKTMTFIIETSGNNREFSAFDDSPADAPRLTLTAKYHRAGETGLPPVFSVRDRLLSITNEMQDDLYTPIVEAYYEAVRYFRGESVLYGKARLNKSQRRVSHPDSYTGGSTDPLNCAFSSSSSCASEVISGDTNYISPITDTCAKNHIVLLTDGEPNKGWNADNDAVATRIQALLSSEAGNTETTCANPSADTYSNPLEKCGRELSRFISNYSQSDLLGMQNITTHTIAFALGSEDDADVIKFLADLATKVPAGGNEENAGQHLMASSSAELAAAFKQILDPIQSVPASFAAPSLSINSYNRFFNGDDIFFSFFEPSAQPLWAGNVKHFKLCSKPDEQNCDLGELMYYQDGVPSSDPDDSTDGLLPATNDNGEILESGVYSVWSTVEDGADVRKGGAGVRVPDLTNRVVYTYLGADNTPASAVSLTGDAPNHKLLTDNDDLAPEMFGLAESEDTEMLELIRWIRGEDVDDLVEGTDLRWRIDDPLHSSPVSINYGIAAGEPVTKLVVGTNNGGIRMINAKNGIEEWLFLPPETLVQQADARQNTGSVRFYGIDGTPSVRVNDNDGDGTVEPALGETAQLVIGMRRGGNRYYALDITPAGILDQTGDADAVDDIPPKFMWSIGGGETGFERLGQTWSKPTHARIRMQSGIRNVLIFGGGYDEILDANYAPELADPTMGNAIFIVDAATGGLIWSASSVSGATTQVTDMKYAIPSDVALLDSDGDGLADRIYVADIAGQMWRVDIAQDLQAGVSGNMKVGKVAELSDLTSPFAATDKRRFFYPPDVVEVLETTYSAVSRYNLLLLTSGNRARPLDDTVQNKMFAIRDYEVDAIPADGYPTIAINALVDVTANLIQDGSTEEIRENAADDLRDPNNRGWFFNLQAPGEKGLAPGTTLEGTFFFTTYTTEAEAIDACKLTNIGGGRLYAVNVLTGEAVLPWNDTTTGITKEDRYMEAGGLGGIPPEFVPVFQEEGVTGCVGTHCGIETGINLPRYRSYWSEALDE